MPKFKLAALPFALLLLAGGTTIGSADPMHDMDMGPKHHPVCPMYVKKYCVADKYGRPYFAFTNSCLAARAGLTIVPDYRCRKMPLPKPMDHDMMDHHG